MTTATATPAPTMCLLHANVHVMDADCWAHTVDWYFAHAHLDQAEARDAYQAEAERAMLDAWARASEFYGRKTTGPSRLSSSPQAV